MTVIAGAITRFAGGVNNQAEGNLFGNLAFPDPTQYNYLFDDFNLFLSTQWSVGGAGTPSRNAFTNYDGGSVLLSTGAGLNDNSWVQTPATGFRFVNGKKMFFSCKAMLVTNNSVINFIAGLQIAVSGNTILNPVNGVYFRKPSGGTAIFLVTRTAGVETVSASLGDVVADQPFECMFYYPGDGQTVIAGFRANATNTPPQTPPPFTTVVATVPSVLVAPMMGIQNSTAVSQNLQVDQMFCAKER
jgi:hypothetical protein